MQPVKREVLHLVSGGKDLFGEWLDGLNDTAGRAAIRRRLDRVEDGLAIVLLLCGGDKRTQWRDILRAQELWDGYRRSR